MAPFHYPTTIRLHHTDAAQRMFFAHQLELAHDAYEAFLKSVGWPLNRIFMEAPFGLPIVHTEADYHDSLAVGDEIEIVIELVRKGKTSFTLGYTLKRNGEKVGAAQTVHVTLDRKTGQKIPLPDEVLNILSHLE